MKSGLSPLPFPLVHASFSFPRLFSLSAPPAFFFVFSSLPLSLFPLQGTLFPCVRVPFSFISQLSILVSSVHSDDYDPRFPVSRAPILRQTLGKPALADMTLGLATAPILYAAESVPELRQVIKRRFKNVVSLGGRTHGLLPGLGPSAWSVVGSELCFRFRATAQVWL